MSVNLLHVSPDSVVAYFVASWARGLGRFEFEQVQEKQDDQKKKKGQLMILLYYRSNKLPQLLEAKVLGKE